MKVYVTGVEWAEPGNTSIQRHYPNRVAIMRRQGGLVSRIREARAWCYEHFGPTGRHHLDNDFILDTERTWASAGRSFYFKDPDDAFWFRMRHG